MGGFDAGFVLFLRIVGVKLDLGVAKFASCQMTADLSAADAGEVAGLKFEEFVRRRTIFVFAETYHL